MTGDGENVDGASKDELTAELRRARSRLRALEVELAETNEGMVALTLELEKAKERYQTIFEESTDGILLLDPDEDAIYEANPQICDLLGYDRDTLVQLIPSDIFPHEGNQPLTFSEAIVHGWVQGFTCRTKDGRNINVDISASVITLDDQSLLLSSLRDVTERKRREQRLQVLTRIFRHNLRNAGNVVLGHADLLADELNDSNLQGNAHQIRQTIDELLELSNKVRQTQAVLDRTQIRLSSLHTIITQQQEWFNQSYPEATLNVKTAQEIFVAHRLNAAIEEILENSVKHVGTSATISIEVEVANDDKRVEIVIEDDGPGIPDHELKVMRSGSESQMTHGSGIGLWLVYWVVDSLGGDLDIRAAERGGTRFSMSVPMETIEPTQKRSKENISS